MGTWNRKSGNPDALENSSDNIQNINLTLVTAPTLSIVSTQEALSYLKLDNNSDDGDLVDDLVTAATGIIEREAGGIAICPQVWKQTQTGGIKRIKTLRQPIVGVPTVSYYDDFDDSTAVNITYSSYFKVIQPNILVHTDGWFEEGRECDGYEITFECGMVTASNYTSTSDPKVHMLKTAILRTIAWLYEQREEHVTDISEGNWKVSYAGELPMGIKRLVMPAHSGEGLI